MAAWVAVEAGAAAAGTPEAEGCLVFACHGAGCSMKANLLTLETDCVARLAIPTTMAS